MNPIQHNFNRAALHYDEQAHVQHETARQLTMLLQDLSVKPAMLLDLGAGTGYCTAFLQEHYPTSTIFGLDFAYAMNVIARQNYPHHDAICADFDAIPCSDQSFDLIFSSLALQETARVLKPGGALVFSTLESQSLCELKAAWQQVDGEDHVNPFLSIAELELSLHQAGFEAIRLKRKTQTYLYRSVSELLRSIKGVGANTCLTHTVQGLGGRKALFALERAYPTVGEGGQYPLTYEVLYVTAQKA